MVVTGEFWTLELEIYDWWWEEEKGVEYEVGIYAKREGRLWGGVVKRPGKHDAVVSLKESGPNELVIIVEKVGMGAGGLRRKTISVEYNVGWMEGLDFIVILPCVLLGALVLGFEIH